MSVGAPARGIEARSRPICSHPCQHRGPLPWNCVFAQWRGILLFSCVREGVNRKQGPCSTACEWALILRSSGRMTASRSLARSLYLVEPAFNQVSEFGCQESSWQVENHLVIQGEKDGSLRIWWGSRRYGYPPLCFLNWWSSLSFCFLLHPSSEDNPTEQDDSRSMGVWQRDHWVM